MSDQQQDATNNQPTGQNPTPAPAAPKQTGSLPGAKKQRQQRDTGPLDGIKNWWNGLSKAAPAAPPRQAHEAGAPGKAKSDIDELRSKIADFDEDYKDFGERILGLLCQIVGYLGPFALVIWVGSDLGKYYTPVMDVTPAYGLAFTIEAIIAACSVAMGRAFAEVVSGRPNYLKAAIVTLIWAILNASSAFGLYLVITNNGNVSGIEQTSMIVRVCAIALGDLGCSAVLMFKGRSIQKHIESIRKRATAIGELADAKRSIEEADKNAELREQQMKATLKIQEDLSNKIGEAVSMVMESILERMEKALKEDNDKNERGYGRR